MVRAIICCIVAANIIFSLVFLMLFRVGPIPADLSFPVGNHLTDMQENLRTTNKTTAAKIFCWVLTSPANMDRAQSVKETWLKRCDGYVFVSSSNNSLLPAIDAGISEGRHYLWGKTKFAFRYAYDNFLTKYDWFLKADDDTFVLVHNLRRLLAKYSSSDALYLGCQFRLPHNTITYMSGGAGYVLSRDAVRRFVESGLNNQHCRQDDLGAEDINMGHCMEKLGVEFVDTRDELERGRFFALSPDFHLSSSQRKAQLQNWYSKYLHYAEKDGPACCADSAISFHYIDPQQMRVMHLLTQQIG